MAATATEIDKRKARIVASMYPTRINRGFKTNAERSQAGKLMGASGRAVAAWETGENVPTDEQVPAIEQWMASGPVWRYDRINHIIGPESWPKPLDMAP